MAATHDSTTDRATQAAQNMADQASERSARMQEQAREASRRATEYGEEYSGYVAEYVKSNPLAAVGIAVAAGFVLASMMRQ